MKRQRSGQLAKTLRLAFIVAIIGMMFVASTPLTSAQSEVTTIRNFDTDEQVIVLTFDAGSDRGYGEEILDTLAEKDVQVTFGMTGVWAEQNPDLMRRIVNDGHDVMNHSWDHPSFTGASASQTALTSAERASQLERTEDIVYSLTGFEMQPYFRPPYGDYNNSVLADLAANGYEYNIMWTVDTLGWQGLSASQINQRVFDGATPGGNILMHVGAASQDAAALPAMIDGLRERGYEFATVRQIVEGDDPSPTERHFPETGYTVRDNFLQYWNSYGGLEVFGYPISDEVEDDDGVTIQHFERARLEYHPDTWSERYDIHLGLLGRELSADRADEEPFQPSEAENDDDCTFYPQTEHNLCGDFREYWEDFGGLAIYGYPISQEFREVNPDTGETYVVQYFERQRFEWHPGEWPERYDVLLGRIGAEMMEE